MHGNTKIKIKILYDNSAVTQNEIFNTFFVSIRVRWARSPWARQAGAGHSSLFKFCHPSIHITVVQSTIPTNRYKFTMNNTVFTFCTETFYDGTLFFSWELHNYQYENSHLKKLHLSLHALAPGVNRFFPREQGCISKSCTVTIKIYALLLGSTSYWKIH